MRTKKIKYPFLLTLALCFAGSFATAQELNYTMNRDFLWEIEKYFNDPQQNFQTFSKPYRFSDVAKIKDTTAAFPRLLAGTKAEEFDKKAKGQIEIYPIMNAEGGYDMAASRFTNHLAIGGQLFAWYKDKIALDVKMLGGKTVLNSWEDSIVRQTSVVPGLGYAHKADNDSITKRYAYQYFSGHLSWSPNKIFNIQLGREKHFLGDGYRSMFLSDVANPYPYLKITARVWHLNYVCLYTILKDVTAPSGFKRDWQNKYATMHYLGWNATKWLNVGLFESIVWQGSDSTAHRGYDVSYLNPVLFFRPAEYANGSHDNALIGASFKLKAGKKQQFYGQLLLDEFLLKNVVDNTGWWANKYSAQLGYKWFDLFTIKHLNFQAEYNYVRPFTYAHGSPQQNYAHFNQPLAHPLGSNFREVATFVNYRYKRLFIEAKCIYAYRGKDSVGLNQGSDLFNSTSDYAAEFGNKTGQGVQNFLTTASIRAAYMLDTRMNAKIELGFAERIERSEAVTKSTPYIFFGLKMDLCNLYNDY